MAAGSDPGARQDLADLALEPDDELRIRDRLSRLWEMAQSEHAHDRTGARL